MSGNIGDGSGFQKGSKNNIFQEIENTPLIERFKIEQDGTLGYRIDIKGVGYKNVGGHLTAINLDTDK